MLQEESCKRIAQMITKSFGQSQMREFAKNCDLDLDRQIKLDEADIVIRDRVERHLKDSGAIRQPRAAGEQLYNDQIQNLMWNPDGNGQDFLGLPSQNTPSKAQISKQVTQKQTPAIQNMKSFFETQISKISERQDSRPMQKFLTMKSQGFGQPNQTGVTKLTRNANSARDISMTQIQSQLPKPKEKPIEYIKIGDIILLTLSVRVFQGDIEVQEATKLLEGGNNVKIELKEKKQQEDQGNVQSLAMSKAIDDPEFIYKGVVSCEGINNLSLQVLPKRTEENSNNAMAQFQKCLFYVENKTSIHYKQLIKDKIKVRNEMMEVRKKTAEKSDYQALAKIDQTLKEMKDELDLLELEKSLEDSNNAQMTKQRMGTKIQYGEEIQLKHVFTDKYLSMEMAEMSDDFGAIKVTLQGLSPCSWIRLIPSNNEQEFRSELLINSKDSKKFNLKIGGHINVRDAFYLVNMKSQTNEKFYLSVDKKKVAHKDGASQILEVNASLHPTKFNAKMFLSHQERKPNQIYSGDVVRLQHSESGCYLQTGARLSGTRSMFSAYPDFLQSEISDIKNQQEEWEGDFKTLNFGTQQEMNSFDDSNQDINEVKEQKDQEVKQNNRLYLETDTRSQSFTDSCFEIQSVNSLKGGQISLHQEFRLKQTVTETFISMDPEGIYLTLRQDALQQKSTVYTAEGVQNDQLDLNSGSQIYLKTHKDSFVQIYQDSKDEINRLFRYKDFALYDFYNGTSREMQLEAIAGKKQKKGEDAEPKMIFRIEKVDPILARVTFECNSYLQSICGFWEMLNKWAVVKNERAEAMYNLCYDGDAAVLQEDLLTQAANDLTDVMHKMIHSLIQAQAKDDKVFKALQRNLSEQKIAECLLYLIELIYYKTVPPEFRNKPFKPDRLLKYKIFDLSHESYLVYQIAKDHLDELNLLILKALMLLIRFNPPNCERVTRFADTLFVQFRRQPNPFEESIESELVKKIFCHMYKCANFIYYDRASIIKSEEGINQNMPEKLTKTQQLTRWLNLLETITYTDTSNQNIVNQVRYFKIISAFCKTMDKNQFKSQYQLQIVQRLFHQQANVPLWVGTQRRTDKSLRPFVYFARLQGEQSEVFMQMNTHIQSCFGQSLNQENDRKFDVIFNVDELTLKYDDLPKSLGPYFDYISAVMGLYTAMCAGRNREAITFVRQRIGVSDTFLLDQCTSHHRQIVQVAQRLKPAYMKLAKVLILEHPPFSIWSNTLKNRVFVWSQLDESEMHNTVYQWEKIKYGDEDNTYGTDADSIRLSTLRLRQIIQDYTELGPQELIEFLYSSEKKQYSDTMVNPKISQLNHYIECAIALLTSENTDTVFARQMMDFSLQILLGISCTEFIDLFADSWIYKLVRVVHRVPECRVKEQKLVLQALEMLQVINDHRLTQQMLQFLKSFKEFELTSSFSHINFDTKLMDQIFKNLFTIQQFNVDTKSLHVLFLMMDPKRKIILDVFEEQQYEEERMRRHKLKAIMEKRAETPRALTQRDQEGNVVDQSFAYTQRSGGKSNRNIVVNIQNKNSARAVINQPEEADIHDKIKALSSTDKEKMEALTNRDLPLDEYLLYFALMRTHLRKIPHTALSIVHSLGRQRQLLLEQLCRVELLVSDADIKNYKTIYFLKDRLVNVSQRLVQEEFTYLLFKVGQQDSIREKIIECQNVLNQVAKLIVEQKTPLLRMKVQNLIRQLDFVNFIFSGLLKTLYFDRTLHKELFNSAMELFFQLSFHNQTTSKSLRPHLAYLADLTKYDIESGKVMAQIIQRDKLSAFGMKFHQFIINKLVQDKNYKPQLFDYLSVVSQNEPVLQSFFLSQIVVDSSFRSRLYMKKQNEKEKIDIIRELVRKRLIFGKGEEKEIAGDLMKVNLHISIVNFLAYCGINNSYGLQQIRRLVELERLMDALLAQSVPFLLKASYFRLFYAGFLQQIGNESSIAINYGKFLQIVRYVVLYDLEQFHEYFNGLVVPYPPGMGEEAMNDPEWKRSKQRVTGELDRQTKETQDKLNSRKTFKQKNEEKEMRNGLSPLNEGTRPYPFLEEKNMIEYWQYLCTVNPQTGQSDGLLIFIKDMYKTLMQKQDQWVDELRDSTQKLYEALISVTDILDNLREMYKQYIINLDDIMIALSEATQQLPQKLQKMNDEVELNYKDIKEEDARMENIMVITRDFIISKNLSIRDGFGIQSLTQDVLVHPYFIKRKIKDICGNDVNFHDIELLVRKIMATTQKKQELQAVVGIELGQPGHIRTRHSAKLHEINTRKYKHASQHKKGDNGEDENETDMFNFKEFEQLLRSKLQKAGFRPPIIRRERVCEETDFMMKMGQDETSQGYQGDLQHFIKCYWEFLHRYSDADEIQDLAKKILQKFNLLFILGSKQNEQSIELSEYTKLKVFMKNLVSCLLVKESGDPDIRQDNLQVMAADPSEIPHPEMISRNHFLLALISQCVNQLAPQYFEKEIRQAASTRHYLLQRIMTQCGMLKAAYSFLSPSQPDEVVSQAFRLVFTLIANENKDVLQALLQIVQEDSFNMLTILKTRIQNCVELLLNVGIQKVKNPEKTLAQKVYDVPSVVPQPSLISQPFYLPDGFTFEVKLEDEQPVFEVSELLFMLKFVQSLVKGLPSFQDILVRQDQPANVDLVHCIGECLIKITETVRERIYTSFKVQQVVEELFRTIYLLSESNLQIQAKLAKWRAIQKTLNFFIEQNFVYYSADSILARNKIMILSLALNLLTLCVQTTDNLLSVICEINLSNLKSQLITIFKFKIGGTPHRDHVYRTDKHCTHKGLCLKGEYCFFQCLVSFDDVTFQCADNLFYVLQQANYLLPIEKLGKIRFNKQAGNLFLNSRKKYVNQMYWESFERIQELVDKIQKQADSAVGNEIKEAFELNELLELIFVVQNHSKIERRYYKEPKPIDYGEAQAAQLFTGIDKQAKLAEKDKERQELAKLLSSQNEFVREEEEEYQYEEVFLELINRVGKQPNLCKKYCCMKVVSATTRREALLRRIFCFAGMYKCRKQKVIYSNQGQKIKFLFEKRKLVQSAEGKVKIDNFLNNRLIEIARKRDFTGPFTGSLTKQILQMTAYVFEQFKYDYVYRFMLSQFASVEVVNKDGKITRQLFNIPTYCMFFSPTDEEELQRALTQKHTTDTVNKMQSLLQKMPSLKMKMKQNQRLARLSPLLYKITAQSRYMNLYVLVASLFINLIFLQSYTYRFDPPKPEVVVRDPMEWLKEFTELKGYKRYVPPEKVIYDPWEIRMKSPELGMLIDLLAISNAVVAILTFALVQLSQSVSVDFAVGGDIIKEDRFTTGSLASSQLPRQYQVQKSGKQLSPVLNYTLNLLTNKEQLKNLCVVCLTCAGLMNLDSYYPFTLVFLAVSELQIVQGMLLLLYRRIKGLLMLSVIAIIVIYLGAYARFLNRECLEVTECYETILRGIVNLANTASWLEASLLLGLILFVFNLFLGLIIDSIAEDRARMTYVDQLLSQRCFICDLSKQDFESAKLDFQKHVEEEHNPMAYLFYLMWVSEQNEESATIAKLTRLVKQQMDKGMIDFIPQRQCLSMQRIQASSTREEAK